MGNTFIIFIIIIILYIIVYIYIWIYMIEIRSHHKWVWTKWDLSNKQCGFTQHTMGYNGVSPTFWYLALSENGVYHKVTFFDGKMDDRYDRPLDLGVPNFQTHPASIATPNRCWTGGHLEIMGKTSSNGIILVHVRHLGMKKTPWMKHGCGSNILNRLLGLWLWHPLRTVYGIHIMY